MRLFSLKSLHARNVLTLMTGTALAQAIPLAISPILTRIYSPNEFGLFALYMAVVSIATVFVTGRYEHAIMLPRSDRDALHITVLTLMLSIVSCIILMGLVVIFNIQIAGYLGNLNLSPWLYFSPLSILLMATYQSLNYWNNRKAKYRRLAINRALQSGGIAAGQLGYASVGASGLVLGQVTGQILATTAMASIVCREDRGRIHKLNFLRIKTLAKKYINFPKYLILAHGLNTATGQLPILLLSSFFGASTAGLFALTQRVSGGPIALIAGAIGDVFRQEASSAYNTQGNCVDIYIKTLKNLLMISVIPFFVFGLIAPELFAIVFGKEWRIAGEYAQILMPKFLMDFIAGPMSVMFMIAERQRMDLLWQTVLMAISFASLWIGFLYSDVLLALIIYSSGHCLMQVINISMTFAFSKKNKKWREN